MHNDGDNGYEEIRETADGSLDCSLAKHTGDVVLTEDQFSELGAQLGIYKDHALGYHEGELGVQARSAWDYYYGKLPAPITNGASGWVDRSVWESVNGVTQELSNVFTSTEEAVKFAPVHKFDGKGAVAATKLVNHILLQQNDGYTVLNDAFKEACVVRNSFIKRYWKSEIITETQSVEGITMEELELAIKMMHIAEGILPEWIAAEVEFDNETGIGSGSITTRIPKEGVCVEYVPFEQVLVEPSATSLKTANYVGHRVQKTKDELIHMGFDKEKVEGMSPNTSDIEAGVIANSRINNISPMNVSESIMVGDDRADKIWLYENYVYTSIPTGELELLQVFTLNNEVLEVNRVNEVPFNTITPFPIPGFVWGESVADITKDIQDLKSFTVRGMIDNVMNANFRRYTAIKGAYDRRSLLDNRPGGVVEIQAAGAVTPMEYHALPQGMGNLLEYIEQRGEQRTGVTRLGQGLNPDVFKNDNAFATVDTMLSAAQNRLRMICRNIANSGMSDLMRDIYNVYRLNAKEPVTIDTAAGPEMLDPMSMPLRNEIIVSLAIGTNERRERGTTLTALFQGTLENPATGHMISPEQAYHAQTEIYKAYGIYDFENYITAPQDLPPPPEPSPEEEMAVQAQMEGIKLIQAQVAEITANIEIAQNKLDFEQSKAADDFAMKREESLSGQAENADKMILEERKLQLTQAVEEGKYVLAAAELELNKERVLIEAQLEAIQERGVSVAGATPSLSK